MSSRKGLANEEKAVEKQRVIVIAGPPGAGKGTQCKRLAAEFGFVHISTGDIFRENVRAGTELGVLADNAIRRGKFVPNDLVLKMVSHRIQQPDAKRGVLLDGFPRTPIQAEALAAALFVERFILLQLPDSECESRVLRRRIDPLNGDVYHLDLLPPPAAVEGRLVRREYDSDENNTRLRIQTYHAQLALILPHFRGKLQAVNGSRPPDEVYQDLRARLLEPAPVPSPELPTVVTIKTAPTAPKAEKIPICCICLSEPADFLCLPCGHQCGCVECLGRIQGTGGGCPICRTTIQGLVKVFRVGVVENDEGESFQAEVEAEKQSVELDDSWGRPVAQPVEGAAGLAKAEGWGEDEAEHKEREELTIEIAPCQALGGPVPVAVKVSVPDLTTRTPLDVCCVVDISGSMSTIASYEADGKVKDDGLTILDIVKHSVSTVVRCLGPSDRFALVAFDDKAELAFSLKAMTAAGVVEAERAVESLQPRGQTNLWGGLLAGMNALRTDDTPRTKCIFLLTDGKPTVSPPQGHVTLLREYLEKHASFHFQLNTFGFGYQLDSELLLDLATAANGSFSFLPDAKIVGTCFVNCIANAATSLTQDASLHLTPKNGASFAGAVLGNFQVMEAEWGRVVSLGPLQFGQSRDIVVPLTLPLGSEDYLEVFVTYPDPADGQHRVSSLGSSRVPTPSAALALARAEIVSGVFSACKSACANRGQAASTALGVLKGKVAGWEAAEQSISPLKADLEGRVTKSFTTKDRFTRWGKHYVRALLRAHQLQQCTNFMDPGLQPYGGTLFHQLVEHGGKVFLALPAPFPSSYNPNNHASSHLAAYTPSTRTSYTSSYSPPSQSPYAPQPASHLMHNYYEGSGGGCFGPLCTVYNMDTGCDMVVSQVRKGDSLQVAGGVARVVCVVQLESSRELLQLKGGLQISPGHPVRHEGNWKKARKCCHVVVPNPSGVLFNFVLDSSHILLVNRVECITWGHGATEGPLAHEFFSTEVVDVLRDLAGWAEGHVRFHL